MIVRILGEGQFSVDPAEVEELNRLDTALTASLEGGDHDVFATALEALLARVRTVGDPLGEAELTPSDAVLPHSGAGVEDVRALLTDEGVIPG